MEGKLNTPQYLSSRLLFLSVLLFCMMFSLSARAETLSNKLMSQAQNTSVQGIQIARNERQRYRNRHYRGNRHRPGWNGGGIYVRPGGYQRRYWTSWRPYYYRGYNRCVRRCMVDRWTGQVIRCYRRCY